MADRYNTPVPSIDRPTFWFTKLHLAVETGDHQAAADAQRQLARLGVEVCYGRPATGPVTAGEVGRG